MSQLIQEKVIFVAALLMGLILWGIAGSNDVEDLRAQNEHYCFMVEMWEQSRGENGWPDYEHKYEEVCQ